MKLCIIEMSESVEVYTEYTYCLSKTFCSQDRWLCKNKLLFWLFLCFKKTCWISCLEERCLIPRIHLLACLHSPTATPSSFPSFHLSILSLTHPSSSFIFLLKHMDKTCVLEACDTEMHYCKRLLFITTLHCSFVVEKHDIGGLFEKVIVKMRFEEWLWPLKGCVCVSVCLRRLKWCDCSGLWGNMSKVFKTLWSFSFSTKWNGIRGVWSLRRKEERL